MTVMALMDCTRHNLKDSRMRRKFLTRLSNKMQPFPLEAPAREDTEMLEEMADEVEEGVEGTVDKAQDERVN